MDWSPTQATQLATASQDCTVKFFDASNPQMTESMLTSAAPVWRAKYTVNIEGFLKIKLIFFKMFTLILPKILYSPLETAS